eukprot:scaffold2339_cov368-Prasinococcus_capsulatus_cf.AAC.1
MNAVEGRPNPALRVRAHAPPLGRRAAVGPQGTPCLLLDGRAAAAAGAGAGRPRIGSMLVA